MVTDREYALSLDENDPLRGFRSLFVITDPEMCYLDGNSLGRLPIATVSAVNEFMTGEWAAEVVTGWSHWVDEAQPTGDLLGRATLGSLCFRNPLLRSPLECRFPALRGFHLSSCGNFNL